MDAGLNHELPVNQPSGKRLARSMVRCVMKMLKGPAPQQAQSLLDCIAILCPQVDIRELQAFEHFCAQQYVDAMRLWSQSDQPASQALVTLCQQALGEPSWLGNAQALFETGDPSVIEILQPWLGLSPTAEEPAEAGPSGETPPLVPSASSEAISLSLRV
ncbi:hypothetical protein GT347_19680 [Xylophilus rhododendri]|uniref:Uncharacterized protein n=1 Tax=Xylophilus rhododendri TaxID=2697032 RepID=A0A857JBB4_9BURK|nr:HrpB1 family type III secretion system apparatus protein [Xylophilus rhododendri]QHJ00006.1 hypothetical protein GT347_19680 [Xylophilus rhododendri]